MGYWRAPTSVICGIGAATEQATGSKDDPLIGMGYRDAWRMAAQTAGIDETQVDLRVNDMNGQRAAFEDEAMGFSRFFGSSRENALEVWHLGSYVGETGASYEARMLAHVDAVGWGRSRAIPKALDWLESEEREEVAAAALVAAAGVVDLRMAQRLSAIVTGTDTELARITVKYLAAAKPIASTLDVLRGALVPDAPVAQVAIALEGLCSCEALKSEVLLDLAKTGRAELAPVLFDFAARIGAAHLCQPLVELVNRDPSACPPAGLLGYLALMPRGTPLPMYPWRTFVAEAPHVAAQYCLLSGASFSASVPAAIAPHPDWIRAMGWCGEVDGLPRLLALLDHEDEAIAHASAMALNMTLAADLYEEVDLVDEDDEPEEDPLTVERLTRSPETWQRVIAAVAPTPGTRLRRGRPWTSHSALECLQDARLSTIDRHWACWEHAVVCKRGFPTHPRHFVNAQRAQLRGVANPSA